MTDEEFVQLLALGRELGGLEFKGPGPRSDRQLFSQVVRAVLGMANRRDGGTVVIGVEDNQTSLTPVGLTDEDLATWSSDAVADGIAVYADPSVSFELQTPAHAGRNYVTIEVREFEDIPVLCKRDFQNVLRNGACYVRTRRKPETSEIPAQAEMRDLLDLATGKGVRRFLARAESTGMISFIAAAPDDRERFDEQLGDLR